MTDITSTIRFIADASQAIGTMRGLAAEAQALNQSIRNVQGQLVARQTGTTNFAPNVGTLRGLAQDNGPAANKLFSLPATTQIDQFNRTLRTTYDTVVLNGEGMEIFRARLSNTTGDVREIESALGRYGQATRIVQAEQESLARSLTTAQTSYSNLRQSILDNAVAERQRSGQAINNINQELQQLRLRREAEANRLPQGTGNAYSQRQQAQRLATIDAQIAAREFDRDVLLAQKRGQPTVNQLLANDPLLQAAKQRVTELQGLIGPTNRASLDLIQKARAGIDAATNLPSPLPASLETVRRESPNLFNRLAGQGLLGPEKGIVDIGHIYQSGADQLQLTRDLERGTTSLRGSIRGLNGELVNVNAAYAEGGRVIGRYGGALSGVQNFLRQTVNNFTKVVQWGLATTAVFAGLSIASNGIETIKNLDASLNQLSITAQLTSRQTGEVFNDLADIAYNTSTPLQEMVKAADDIALATKRANQSTVEWQANIKSLANSVGILTNITGLDTVRATDLLTSTMKQLNLQAQDIPTILNKVAAVAGGQANAITDVVSGLGAMAEAAEQANLSIDQTIATVQVLGQVTSKSSTEVATAFKNLVGSVDSVGAQKQFEKYGISIKDQAGQLRNILDIYDEINQKIKSGVIPESDVKALVKGIAGGPRRAPDAAALLANIDAIREATEKSVGATNEAFVANLKYLDTIESKITQIQVKFDAFVQKTFGPALKGFVNDLTNVLTGLFDVLARIDPNIIKTILGFTSLLVAIKAISGVLRFFGGAVADVVSAFAVLQKAGNAAALAGTQAFRLSGSTANLASQQAQQAVSAAAREIAELELLIATHERNAIAARADGNAEIAASEQRLAAAAAAQRSAALQGGAGAAGAAAGAGGLLGRLKAGALGLAGPLTGGLVGAGLTAATGGNLTQTIGSGILGTGLSLLASPLPIPHLKLLSAALIGVGGALTFLTGESKTATDSVRDLSEQVQASINQYKEAQANVNDLGKAQSDAKAEFDLASYQYSKNEGSLTNLNSKVVQYAQATYDLAKANSALDQSFKDLSQSGSKLSSDFAKQIEAAKNGLIPAEALKELQDKIYKELFAETNPDLAHLANIKVAPIVGTTLQGTGTQATFQDKRLFIPEDQRQPYTIDLKNLTEASDILKLFSDDAKTMDGSFQHSAEAVDLINRYLQETVERGGALGDRAKIAQETFGIIVSQFDILANADLFGKQQDALLQTKQILGEINGDEAKQGQANIAIYKELVAQAAKLSSIAPQGPSITGAPLLSPQEELQRKVQQLLINPDTGDIKTGKFSIDQAREIVDLTGITKGLKEGVKLTDQQIYELATKVLGVSVEYTDQLAKAGVKSQELLEIQENLDKVQSKALDNLASKSADIQRRYLSGDITKKMRDALLAGAKATNELDNKVVALLTNLSENTPNLVKFEDELSKIPGLENLTGKNADEAASLMIEFFDSLDLTKKGANQLITRIVALIAAINAIPPETDILIKIQTQYTSRADFIATEGNDPDSRDKANKAFSSATTQAKNQLQAMQNQINNLIKQLQAILSGKSPDSTFLGSGGSKSGGTKTAIAPDVSELDLPDEIANAANRDALIKEAIRRARALQHLVPGADKEAKNDIVELLKGTQRILEVRGIKDDYLRRALEELADVEKKRLDFETKADTISRIRVGFGDFSALANVPLNSKTGVSLGGPEGPINITLNLNGTVLTPAQLAQFADLVAAALKRQLAGG